MKITCNYYPRGKTKAVTMSYDDGQIFDRRLVEIFNKYGIRGSFHLNSGRLDKPGFVSRDELSTLYHGHEISLHTQNHPSLAFIPAEAQISEIMEDRAALESATGYVISGLSYPMGSYDSDVIARLENMGVLYARTTQSHGAFSLPDNFLTWHPTMHHSRGKSIGDVDRTVLMKKAIAFAERPDWFADMPLLYIWGHSYEFENDCTWELIEDFCAYISGFSNIWFATNIAIFNYVQAIRNLRFSAKCDMVYNPSADSVWIGVDGYPVEIPGGKTTKLQ